MDQKRWEELFADLDAQLAAQERLDVDAEAAERTRRERALVGWQDRIAGQGGEPLTMHFDAGAPLTGTVSDLGADWALLRSPASGEVLLRTASVLAVHGLGSRAREAVTARRFGFGAALRVMSRDRATVEVLDRAGRTHTGTIDIVHGDAIELARHEPGQPRRAANVTGRVVIPFEAVVWVRRR